MDDEIFSIKEVIIFNILWLILFIIMVMTIESKINDLEKQVEEYKTLYNDERIVSKVLKDSCDNK